MLPVFGMQNAAARMEGCAAPSVSAPAGAPVSATRFAAALPNAPAWLWPGQNFPSAAVSAAVPLVSGVRLPGTGAWKPVNAGGQSLLLPGLPPAVREAAALL